ncbi:MAG: epoxyqueuosine reductase QueH [bacterium]|nr:epoxyqueuosine reductase QueH [bacterium]
MVQLKNKNILIHACCGICSGYPISLLKEMGYLPVVYFCNPNLDTEEEFRRRLDAQKKICENFEVELIVEKYNHTEFLNYVSGLEQEPERGKRCEKCIELRLGHAAQKTKELGFVLFTTSLVISPHKNFEMIKNIGECLASKYELEYLALDFKKKDGFLKTNKISKKLNIYRQNYCGCEFAKSHLQ